MARRPARSSSSSAPPGCATPTSSPVGRRPGGPVPGDPRLRRGGRGGSTSAPAVTSVAKGDHVIPLYTPECRACKSCLSPQDQPLHRHPRDAGQGLDARREPAVLHRQDAYLPLHGLLHVRASHGDARDCGGQDPARRAVRQGLLRRLRRDHRGSAPCSSPPRSRQGANVVVFGLGGIGLNVVQGARMVGADKIIGVDVNPARERHRPPLRPHALRQPAPPSAATLVAHLVELTGGGADYSFECVGDVKLMRQALECCHRGWGVSVVIGVAGAGQEIQTRPFQLVTGRVWKGKRVRRGPRPHRRTARSSIGTWRRRLTSIQLITHKLPLERMQLEAFDLMHAGSFIRAVVEYLSGNRRDSLPSLRGRAAGGAARRSPNAMSNQRPSLLPRPLGPPRPLGRTTATWRPCAAGCSS